MRSLSLFKKPAQLVAALLMFWLGAQLAAWLGVPLAGERLVGLGVQAALAQVAPEKVASPWSLQVHVASVQPTQRAGAPWNTSNDGFAVRYAFSDTYAVQAGHYRNEHTVQGYNFFANYVYGDYTPLHLGPVRLGVFAGVVSGYDDYCLTGAKVTEMTEVGLAPKAGLVGRYQWRLFNATLRLNPALRHAGPASLSAEFGFSFK